MSAEAIEGFLPEQENAEVVQLFSHEETEEEKRRNLENKQRHLRERMGEISRQQAEIQAEYLACIAAIMTGDEELRAIGGDPNAIKYEYLSKVSPTSAAADYGKSHLG